MSKLLIPLLHRTLLWEWKLNWWCSFQWQKIHLNLMHVCGAHSATFRRISQRENILDSYLLPRKPKKKFTGLEMQSSYRSGFLFGRKGSSLGGSKIFLDLFGNHSAPMCPPTGAQMLPFPQPAPNLRDVRPLTAAFLFLGRRQYAPEEKENSTLAFSASFLSRTVSCTSSEWVFNKRRIGKSCKRNNVNFCLVFIHLKASLKSELAADVSFPSRVHPQYLSDVVFSKMESAEMPGSSSYFLACSTTRRPNGKLGVYSAFRQKLSKSSSSRLLVAQFLHDFFISLLRFLV